MVSRRSYLQSAGAAAIGALAGCNALPFIDDSDRRASALLSEAVHTKSQWGSALAVDGDTLVVGAPAALTRAGTFGGAAFVFEYSGGEWVKQARLRPPSDDLAGPMSDVHGRLSFGSRVAVRDGVAVVASNDAPGVYWYERDGGNWTLEGSLTPGNGTPENCFLREIAFDGRWFAAATACRPAGADHVTETIHVYAARDDWPKNAELRRDTPPGWDRYGYGLAVDGDTLVAASDVGGERENRLRPVLHVYEHRNDGWAKRTALRPSPAYHRPGVTSNDLALDGDSLVLGGLRTESGRIPGRVYAYDRSGGAWTRTAVLQPDGLSDAAHYGAPVALAGDALVVGAPGATLASGVEGAAFLYERSNGEWRPRRQYAGSGVVRDGGFGGAVAAAGHWSAVGGRVTRENRTDRPAVYVFPR